MEGNAGLLQIASLPKILTSGKKLALVMKLLP
jgi:hypothetical protein